MQTFTCINFFAASIRKDLYVPLHGSANRFFVWSLRQSAIGLLLSVLALLLLLCALVQNHEASGFFLTTLALINAALCLFVLAFVHHDPAFVMCHQEPEKKGWTFKHHVGEMRLKLLNLRWSHRENDICREEICRKYRTLKPSALKTAQHPVSKAFTDINTSCSNMESCERDLDIKR